MRNESVLLYGVQGFGDQILYLSMLDTFAGQAGALTVSLEPRLVNLVQRSFAHVKVMDIASALAQTPGESHLGMGSLGRYCRNSWDDFPLPRQAYLKADPACTAQLRTTLTARKKKVCGLSWISKGQAGNFKSMKLQDLRPLFDLPNFEFVDLQYGDTTAQRQALHAATGVQLLHLPEVDLTQDIDGVAALISACDVIVTISNTTAFSWCTG